MDLTKEQWAIIQPLIPPPSPAATRGRPPINERAVLNGILWKLRSSAPWYDMPPQYPSYQTCYRRYRKWRHTGLLQKILSALYIDLHERGGLNLNFAVDDSVVSIVRKGPKWVFKIDPDLEDTWQLSTAMIFIQMAVKKVKDIYKAQSLK